MKRSIQAVLALFVVVAAFGLTAAPSGAAVLPKAKVFTISSAPATSVWSQAVKLTVTLTPKGGGQPKGGTVTFLADGTPVGTATATTRNTTLTTTTLPPGDHTITASYSGDGVIASGTTTNSSAITVGPAPTTVNVQVTQDPVPYEETAEIKAVVRPAAPAAPTRRPTGTVTFTTDTCITATVAVNSNGVATWRPWLCPGTHVVTATYNGSDRHAGSVGTGSITVLDPDGNGPDDENIDQVNNGDPVGILPVMDDSVESSSYAQTFTPGRTGRLYAVDVVPFWYPGTDSETPPGPLLVSIQTLDQDGLPTGAVLGEGSIPTEAIEGPGGPYHLDLTTPADVEVGVSYAIVLEVAPQTPEAYGGWGVFATEEDSYTGGSVLERLDGGAWLPFAETGADLMFRTHMGDPV